MQTLMYIVISNYSLDSMALIQFLKDIGAKNVYCLSVETGFSSERWPKSKTLITDWITSLNYTPITLKPKISLPQLVEHQNNFPSPKFASCVSQIIAPTRLAWIEKHDPTGSAIITLAKRRQAARAYTHIPETIPHSKHYNQRKLWHPLCDHTNKQRDELIKHAKVTCDHTINEACWPCIHCPTQTYKLDENKRRLIKSLELKTGKNLYAENIETTCSQQTQPSTDINESLASSCGSPFGCGL